MHLFRVVLADGTSNPNAKIEVNQCFPMIFPPPNADLKTNDFDQAGQRLKNSEGAQTKNHPAKKLTTMLRPFFLQLANLDEIKV